MTEKDQIHSRETAAAVLPPAPASTEGAESEKKYVRSYVLPGERAETWTRRFAADKKKPRRGLFAQAAERGKGDASVRRRAVMLFWLAAAVVLIGVLAVPLWRICSSRLVIADVEIVGEIPYTEDELLAAAGFSRGSEIFSFRRSKAEEAILEQLPYLTSVTVRRRLPDRVVLTASAEKAVLYTEMNGQYFALSESLRVLERSTDNFAYEAAGLYFTELPRVSRAVVGERLTLAGGIGDAFIGDVLRALRENGLGNSVTELELGEKFELTVVLDGRYTVCLGSPKDVSLKLLTARRIIEENDFEKAARVIIDVTVPEVACARLESGSAAVVDRAH